MVNKTFPYFGSERWFAGEQTSLPDSDNQLSHLFGNG
jgi:hypothetical protein